MDGLRRDVAHAAAQIIYESGLNDFRLAKEKAAEQLGCPGAAVPSNLEVADALAEYLAVYGGDDWRRQLRQMRQTALEAMKLCRRFNPRLVGAVASGLVHSGSRVQLHIFAEFDEAVDFYLADCGIPYELADTTLKHPNGREMTRPACLFMAGDVEIELVIFSLDDQRWTPLSKIDGKAMQRLDQRQLDALI